MTILLVSLLLLFLVPCKFHARGFHLDRYIGQDGIQPVKGIFLILVFASHFCQYVTLGGGLDDGYLSVRKFLGQMIVVPLLFYLGYGIVSSIRREGTAYLLSIPAHRILKVAFQFAVAVLLYVAVQRYCMGKTFSVSHVWFSILGWKSVGNSNWFVLAILLLHALTFLSFWAFDRPQYPHAPLIALTLLTIVLMAILSTARPTYCYNTLMAYVAGAWFYGWKKHFDELFLANHRAWAVGLAGFVLAFCLLQPYFKSTLVCSGASVAFAFAVILISAKVVSRNAILSYCGRHLFSLYILQRLPMLFLSRYPWMKSHVAVYFVLSLAITLALAWIFDWIMPKIWSACVALARDGVACEPKLAITPELSGKISAFGLLAMVMVVFIHCGDPKSTSDPGWWFWQIWAGGLCRVAVPYFFLVSGLFVGRRMSEYGWWRAACGKRFFSLVVPYVFWSAVAAVFLSAALGYHVFNIGRVWRILGLDMTCWPEFVPLWYVRALIMFVLVLPIVFVRNKWASACEIVALLALATTLHGGVLGWTDCTRFFTSVFSLWGLGFFLAGIWLAHNAKSLELNLPVAIVCLGAGLLLMGCTIGFSLEHARHVNVFRYSSVPFLLAGMWGLFPKVTPPRWCLGLPFPVYLLHGNFTRLGHRLFNRSVDIVPVLAIFAMAIAGSLIIIFLLRRFAPRFASVVFGGR